MTIGSASLLAAGLYFGLSPRVAKKLYVNMLFHPHPYSASEYAAGASPDYKCQDLFFRASDGTELHAWYFQQDASKKTVLLSHGNTGNISGRPALLEAILKSGVNLFAYDYRGFGRSLGEPSVDGVIDDACSAHDFLVKEMNTQTKDLVLYGESLGVAVSCQLSSRRESAGLILQSGFSSLSKISKHHIPLMHLYPPALYPQPPLDNVKILSRQHPPLLIVHGHKDSVVPFSHGKLLYESAVGKKRFVDFPEAEHSDIPIVAQERFVSTIRQFLAELD